VSDEAIGFNPNEPTWTPDRDESPTFREKRERLVLDGMFHQVELVPGEYPAGVTSWLLKIVRGGANGVWVTAEHAARIRAYFAPDAAATRQATHEVLNQLADPVGISVDEALNAIERIYR
jgi:hypothetical protein